MEDEDEFGDLYTDVLRPFAAPSPHPSSSTHPPIDLNLQTHDGEILYGTSGSNSALPYQPKNQSSDHSSGKPGHRPMSPAAAYSGQNLIGRDERDGQPVDTVDRARDIEGGDVKLRDGASEDVKDVDLMDKDVRFDAEEDGVEVEDVGPEPIIPGLSSGGGSGGGLRGEGDEWDSDSDDDLQIVLNDNNHGHVGMERGGGMIGNGDDDDEDEDGLVIVADGDANQATEEQDWGEDTAQAADGERKEMGETGKSSVGVAVAPKIGYSSHIHGYHPFHSQFKVSVLRVA